METTETLCGVRTPLFGGKTCERVEGHSDPGRKHTEHRSGTVTWIEVPPEEAA